MTAEATRWLISQGVRMMGCDAITFDPPVWAMFERKQFWEAHRVMWDEEYWHLENLMNLDQIGRPHGFTLERPAGQVGAARRRRPCGRSRSWMTDRAVRRTPAARDVDAAGGKGASLAAHGGARPARAARLRRPGRRPRRDAARVRRRRAAADAARGLQDAELAAAADEARGARPRRAAADGLEAALAEAYAGLGEDVPVAVRSSAVAEDSDAASFAGQQETFLHVRGAGRVGDARARLLGVVLQRARALLPQRARARSAICAWPSSCSGWSSRDVAGVLFTVDPVSGAATRWSSRPSFGLGEPVVSGDVTPDHYVHRPRRAAQGQSIAVQPYAVVRGPDGGTVERALDADEGGRQTLTEDELRRLAELGRTLQERSAARRTSSGRWPAASSTCCSPAR